MSTRKRANGEGSIFWNEERHRFEGLLNLEPVDGKRRRRKVTGASRKEVAAKLAEVKRQVEDGLPVTGAAMTVNDLLDRWLATLPAKVAPSAVETYTWAADGHLRPALGSKQIVKLTFEDVEGLLGRKAETMSANSVSRIRSVLGQALRWAEKRNYVVRNVASLADMPACKPTREGRALTAVEARALLDAAKGHRLEALWLTELTLGLRPGEVAGLSWSDIDVEGGVIHVRSSLSWHEGVPSLVKPKTERSRRSLSVSAPVVAALRAHRLRQVELRLVLGASWPTEWAELVFTTESGTPIDPANARRELRALAKKAGIEGSLRPYDLRHSAASLLAAAGVPLEHVADVLGHDGLRMSRTVYVHALAPSISAAVGPMERMLAGG